MRRLTESAQGMVNTFLIVLGLRRYADDGKSKKVCPDYNIWAFHCSSEKGLILVYEGKPGRVVDCFVCDNEEEIKKRLPEFKNIIVAKLV